MTLVADIAETNKGRYVDPGWPTTDPDDHAVSELVADRTGVEMEALTAVSVAALTLYDMIKAVDRAARIDDIKVLSKAGGRTGEWRR